MEKLSVVRCDNYGQVKEAVRKLLEPLGGIEAFVKPGDRVAIKPNLVSKKQPTDAVTTHPALLAAVCETVIEAGGRVIVAESPGGPYNKAILKSLYSACGVCDAVDEKLLNYDVGFTEIVSENARTVRSFTVINPILNADVVISLPKLKTHCMTGYTGAVKNMFGVIPGTHKAEMHFRLSERKDFCSMLVDLCQAVTPQLSIMDGVWGMEGNGPTAGTPRKLGLLMASANPYAMDLAACHIIGYRPDEIDTVRDSIERELCPDSVDKLEISGDGLDEFLTPDFKKPQTHFELLRNFPLPGVVRAWVAEKCSAEPEIAYDECVSCGECARCCPPKAIDMSQGKPLIDRRACIKCFCCQELCPKKAVKIKRTLLNRFMLKFLR